MECSNGFKNFNFSSQRYMKTRQICLYKYARQKNLGDLSNYDTKPINQPVPDTGTINLQRSDNRHFDGASNR